MSAGTAISVVVVVKDEEADIERLIAATSPHFAEVLVADSGSTDGTKRVAEAAGARVIDVSWEGFGPTKNAAVAVAAHDWIVSLDADEVPDALMVSQIRAAVREATPGMVFGLKRVTNFCGTWVRHGAWRNDVVWRVYHRDTNRWDDRAVHERLLRDVNQSRVLAGELLHYSFVDEPDYLAKHRRYAILGAEALHAEGRRATWAKRHLSPVWRAFRGYVLRGGWRDGAAGWRLAQLDYRHVKEKYALLRARSNR